MRSSTRLVTPPNAAVDLALVVEEERASLDERSGLRRGEIMLSGGQGQLVTSQPRTPPITSHWGNGAGSVLTDGRKR